jgi:enediyne biosynthesis protein E4
MIACVLTIVLTACGPPPADVPKNTASSPSPPNAPVQSPVPLVFRAQELPFRYERGESGSAWPVEPVGGGVGLLDFDGDGDLDLFFAQGVRLPVGSSENPPADVLLRNDGNGHFADVSAEVGLSSKGYGLGVAVADYDGDGDPDVYVTRYGGNTLWRNDKGHFTDVTAEAGVACGLWSLGAAFADVDNDGDLDLFVVNYFKFNPADAPFARDPVTGAALYDLPTRFVGEPDVLYRNDGNGHFTDITAQAGVAGKGRGMGCVASDFDRDGHMDFFVANDAMANALWRNNGDGTFEDVAEAWGVAYNGEGISEANMGIAHGDFDADLLPDLYVTHFVKEHGTLWRAHEAPGGGVFYRDWTLQAGLGTDSLPDTGWGTAFADFDQDGFVDLISTNGHIRPEPSEVYPYANPPLLWRNGGRGRFQNVNATGGPYFTSMHQGRGLAVGDLDGDGDLDMVIVHHNAPSVVLWNETPHQGNLLLLQLTGAKSNRDAIGARVTARAGERKWFRSIDGGGSYISASDLKVHFGLGPASRVDLLEVRWPSGRVETRSNLAAGSIIRWKEDENLPKP